MTQQAAIDSLLFDMLKKLQVTDEQKAHIKEYLNYSYAIGYQTGVDSLNNAKPVAQMLNGKIIHIWPNAKKASLALGFSPGMINKVLLNKDGYHKTAGGYEWKFYDENNLEQTIGDF